MAARQHMWFQKLWKMWFHYTVTKHSLGVLHATEIMLVSLQKFRTFFELCRNNDDKSEPMGPETFSHHNLKTHVV